MKRLLFIFIFFFSFNLISIEKETVEFSYETRLSDILKFSVNVDLNIECYSNDDCDFCNTNKRSLVLYSFSIFLDKNRDYNLKDGKNFFKSYIKFVNEGFGEDYSLRIIGFKIKEFKKR